MMSLPVIIITVALMCFALTCWALFDVAYRDFSTIGRKAAWAVIAFIPFVGWIIYLLFGIGQGVKRENTEQFRR